MPLSEQIQWWWIFFFFMFDFRMSENCRVVYLMLYVSSNTPFYTFILFAVRQLCTLWWQLLLKIVFVSTAGIDESVVTFETLFWCRTVLFWFYLVIFPWCACLLYVWLYMAVWKYMRDEVLFMWLFIWIKKIYFWNLFLCLDVFFPTYLGGGGVPFVLMEFHFAIKGINLNIL